jgi:hypothetical protein
MERFISMAQAGVTRAVSKNRQALIKYNRVDRLAEERWV